MVCLERRTICAAISNRLNLNKPALAEPTLDERIQQVKHSRLQTMPNVLKVRSVQVAPADPLLLCSDEQVARGRLPSSDTQAALPQAQSQARSVEVFSRKQAIKKMALTIETRRRKQSLCNIFYVFVIKLLCPKDDDKKKLASEPRQLVRSTEVLNGVMGEMRLESHLSADGDGTMFYPDTPKAGV